MALYAKIDVSFPDDPKVVDAGDLAELVYLRCVLRSRQQLTDGVIDRRVAPRWCAGIRGRLNGHFARLVEVGLLAEVPEGWAIPEHAWRQFDLEAEVRRRRWHVYCRRHEIFARDGYRCVHCGASDRLEVDHVISIARNGSDDIGNLQTLCKPCNSGKRDR